MNDFYCINLHSITDYHDTTSDLKKFINSDKFSDFKIKNNNSFFYSHKILFFQRIPCEDIAKSRHLLDVYSKNKELLDLTNLKISDEIVLNLLEILYLGNFLNHKSSKDFHKIYTIFEALNLNLLKVRILKYLKFKLDNMPPCVPNSEILKMINTNTFLIINDGSSVLIGDRSEQSIKQKSNDISKSAEKWLAYRSKILHRMISEMKRDNYSANIKIENIERPILYHIGNYILNDQLPFLFNDLTILVDLLYFSDYLCFDSLFSVSFKY